MSAYITGTVTVTNGDATVVGVGTSWLTEITAGDLFSISGSGVTYEVASVTDDTHLELSANYAGTSGSGKAYMIVRDFTESQEYPYTNPGDTLNTVSTIVKRLAVMLDDSMNKGFKQTVRVATTAALAANTRSGNVLTADANGALAAIDGVSLVVGNRLLVKDEGTGANNGIYVVTDLGDASNPWVLTRAGDFDTDAEVFAQVQVPVAEGSANADLVFGLTTNDPITLNTTALAFAASATGPQGAQGAQGVQGAQGTQGVQGAQGDTGAQGAQGNQGNQGDTGAQGPQGTQGNQGTQGAQGVQGAQGSAGAAGGVDFVWSSSTTMADPGSGYARFNNATLASVTAIAIDDLTASAVDVSGWITSFDDSDSTIKGTLTIVKDGDFSVIAIYDVTGLTDNVGWTELAVSHHSSGGTFTNNDGLRVFFSTTGDKGTQGAQGAAGAQGAQGDTGAQGAQGTQGVQGAQGAQGAQGTQGNQGTQGVQGAQGAQGAAGTTPTTFLVLSAAGGTPTTTAGCASPAQSETTTNKINYFSLDFDAATDENASWMVRMPTDWNASTVTATFLWTASNTGNVVWACQAVGFSDDDALDTAHGTAQSVTDGVTAAGDVMISAATSAITIGNSPAAGDFVVFRVYRDADNGSDTCTVDAKLLAVYIAYGVA